MKITVQKRPKLTKEDLSPATLIQFESSNNITAVVHGFITRADDLKLGHPFFMISEPLFPSLGESPREIMSSPILFITRKNDECRIETLMGIYVIYYHVNQIES